MYAQGLSARAILDAQATLDFYPPDDLVSLFKRLPQEQQNNAKDDVK